MYRCIIDFVSIGLLDASFVGSELDVHHRSDSDTDEIIKGSRNNHKLECIKDEPWPVSTQVHRKLSESLVQEPRCGRGRRSSSLPPDCTNIDGE